MIPADWVKFSLDGTQAWWAVEGRPATDEFDARPDPGVLVLSRSCEWCDDGYVDDLDNDGGVIRCPECYGSGRHCFPISVPIHYDALENAWIGGQRFPQFDHVGAESSRRESATLTVSVVPDMVLQVQDIDNTSGPRQVVPSPNGRWWVWDDAGEVNQTIDAPAATKPGDWLVKLDIHQGATS